jgi:hypothetical protein
MKFAVVERSERAVENATLRVRRHPDSSYVVRVDRFEQAPDGRDYRRERVADRERADELLAEWKGAFDLPEE